MRTFAPVKTKGSLAQLNRAFDYGSKGCGFESRRSHMRKALQIESLQGLFLSYLHHLYTSLRM